jgi:hypothetical protein
MTMTDTETRVHEHPWPAGPAHWAALADCARCGITLLKHFRFSSQWVVRRVENARFIDDCTVRRYVSIDYEAPSDAVLLRRPTGEEVRVLPLAILRRKSLVNFDFRDPDGAALPLLGLRQNQALTLASARAWAQGAPVDGWELRSLPDEVGDFLDDVIAGDQAEMRAAYARLGAAPAPSELHTFGADAVLQVAIDRFADSFILYHLHCGRLAERRVVKFSYDEPFTLRHYRPSYRRGPDGMPVDRGESTKLKPYSATSLKAALGFAPTVIEFPVPAAELTASFHFQIAAPPEVSIAGAALLAGRPGAPGREDPDATGPAVTEPVAEVDRPPMKTRRRPRPSFDRIGGGYPIVDLHLVDVPYGSRSHAQVTVEPRTDGWFASAVFASWVASLVLLLAWLVRPAGDVGSALLMSFVAGLVAILARPNPHRLVARLLSKVRLLAMSVALLTFVAAVLVAFVSTRTAHVWIGALFVVAAALTLVVSAAWLSAVRRRFRRDPEESPWEHRRPRGRVPGSAGEAGKAGEAGDSGEEKAHEVLARDIENAASPYDYAFEYLGFDRPAVRVASCESSRDKLVWNAEFARLFDERLARTYGAAHRPC